jgi:hypothetical protein
MSDDTRWFHGPITREMAERFFQQAHDFTTEVVINYMPETAQAWPLGNQLFKPFEPQGAVVTLSHSPSMWNSFHLHTRNVYSSHILVMSGRRMVSRSLNHYDMLEHIPATILAPHPIDVSLPHAGWLSTKTWGIELRSCGLLRPHEGQQPPAPLTGAEVNDDTFRVGVDRVPTDFDFFWRSNMWRKPFTGKVYGWEGYFFELPSCEQIETMIIVLRCMNALAGKMDRRLILPSNCVKSDIPTLPILPWKALRTEVTENWDSYDVPPWVDTVFHPDSASSYEREDLDYYDEGTIAEQLSEHRWRIGHDDGQLDCVDWRKEFLSQFAPKPRFYRELNALGFDNSDARFALDVYAISAGLQGAADQDIISALLRDIDLYSI